MSAEFLEVRPLVLVANVSQNIGVVANFFQLMQASANVTIEFFHNGTLVGTATDVPEGFRRGPVKEGREWDRVRITSAIGQTISYCLSFGEASLQRLTGNITATLTKSTTLTSAGVSFAAVTGGVLAAADAGQREIIISFDLENNPTHPGPLRVGGSTVPTDGIGIPLYPGESVTLETAGAVYAYNSHATIAAVVYFTRVKD